jgi:hypothetical protein
MSYTIQPPARVWAAGQLDKLTCSAPTCCQKAQLSQQNLKLAVATYVKITLRVSSTGASAMPAPVHLLHLRCGNAVRVHLPVSTPRPWLPTQHQAILSLPRKYIGRSAHLLPLMHVCALRCEMLIQESSKDAAAALCMLQGPVAADLDSVP